MARRRQFGYSQKLGYWSFDSSDLVTSNEDGSVFFDHAVVDFGKIVFLAKGWLGNAIYVIARSWDIGVLIPRILLRRMKMAMYFSIM